jgi:hypothetical protein
VHGVGPGLGRDLDDLLDVEVGLGGGAPVQGVGLVGQPGVESVDVLLGVDGDAAQPGVPAGPDDADRDLATIRDEDLAHDDLFSRSAPSVPGACLSSNRPGLRRKLLERKRMDSSFAWRSPIYPHLSC